MQANTARAALPVLAAGSVITLTFRGKSEQWRIFDVHTCSDASAADMQRRGWEAKHYSASRIITKGKRANAAALVYRSALTGQCEIAVLA